MIQVQIDGNCVRNAVRPAIDPLRGRNGSDAGDLGEREGWVREDGEERRVMQSGRGTWRGREVTITIAFDLKKQ